MWPSPVAAALGAVALFDRGPDLLAVSAPVLVLWLFSPALSWWLSQPVPPQRPQLTADDRGFLRLLARQTWLIFETFIAAQDNFLPPDNFQEDPPRGIAHRTSPTNIGLALTANLAAYDFGYLNVSEVIARTEATCGTLDKLQRFRGHFYNWYDTQSLEPLRPTYVSTVDSGNLAGHLLTLVGGLNELAHQPVFRAQLLVGLADTLAALGAVLAKRQPCTAAQDQALNGLRKLLAARPRSLHEARRLLESLVQAGTTARELFMAQATDRVPEGSFWLNAFRARCQAALEVFVSLLPWIAGAEHAPDTAEGRELLAELDRIPTLEELARLEQELTSRFEALAAGVAGQAERLSGLSGLQAAVAAASQQAAGRLTALAALANRATEFADIDYEFLYDRGRHLLALGYNVADRRLDGSIYGLLASEARLASFFVFVLGLLL